jgi:hypothetical protein
MLDGRHLLDRYRRDGEKITEQHKSGREGSRSLLLFHRLEPVT